MEKINVLYIEDDPIISELYALIIKKHFENIEVAIFSDGLKAIEEIKKHPSFFNLIISDYRLPTVSGAEVFKFVNGQMLGIPFIVLSGFDCTNEPGFNGLFHSHVRNAVLVKPASSEILVDKIKWCLGAESDILKIYSKSASCCDEKIAISSDVFLRMNIIPCDVFLKLNDEKFVKVINKKEIFESTLIQKLILKGINMLYVNRSELSNYSESVVTSLTGLLKIKKLKGDEIQKSQLNTKAINLLKGNLLKCGFSEPLMEAADEIVELQLQLINSTKEFSDFLEKYQIFNKASADYSRIVNYVSVAILKELTWDSESTIHRMCFASLLHDVTLPEALYKREISLEQIKEKSEEEHKNFYHHPEEAAHLAKNFEKVSSGIEQFILEHHELPDGSGFPQKKNYNQIHPLSAVLHLSSVVAELMIELNFEIDSVKTALNEKRTFYSRGFYRKPYDAICRVLKISYRQMR